MKIMRGDKKAFLPIPALALALLAAVSGCQKNNAPATGSAKIAIRGSNTIGEELGPRLIAEYKKQRPDVAISIESKGTGTGLSALLSGQCDIAAASRTPTAGELALSQSNGVDLNCYIVGSYAVAVIVNANNPVSNVTRDQIRDIYTGTVTNWKALGGPDVAIKRYARDPVSGTYFGFRELFMENKPYAKDVTTRTNYESIADAVANDPNAIGYVTIYLAKTPGVKGLAFQGVFPETHSVTESRYPFARVLRLYTNKATEAPAVKDFINFVQSARGQAIVAEMGYVPRP